MLNSFTPAMLPPSLTQLTAAFDEVGTAVEVLPKRSKRSAASLPERVVAVAPMLTTVRCRSGSRWWPPGWPEARELGGHEVDAELPWRSRPDTVVVSLAVLLPSLDSVKAFAGSMVAVKASGRRERSGSR